MRIEFREHPKWGSLEADIDGERVTITKVELFKEAKIAVVTFKGPNGKTEEVVMGFLSREGPYALQA